jgi:hypothetical protein
MLNNTRVTEIANKYTTYKIGHGLKSPLKNKLKGKKNERPDFKASKCRSSFNPNQILFMQFIF